MKWVNRLFPTQEYHPSFIHQVSSSFIHQVKQAGRIARATSQPGASPGQWLVICHVIRYPRARHVQTHKCVRHTIRYRGAESSEARIARADQPGMTKRDNSPASATTYGTHRTLPVLSCCCVLFLVVVVHMCCVVNVVCCDSLASTDQRARGTFVQTF